MIVIEENVKFTVEPLFAIYSTGRPGMPMKAELPTAAPVQDGAAIAVAAVAAVLVARRLNDSVEPSPRLNEKFWPPADRAVASL